MKNGLRYARLSAAIAAVIYGASPSHARNLTWDPSGAAIPADGSGNWDTSSLQWFDPGTSSVVAWSNANPDSAVFGTTQTSASVTPNSVLLNANLTVQDMTFNNATNGAFYNIGDQGDSLETLTLDGNILKNAVSGGTVFNLSTPINLSAGNHVITLQDSPGDTPPEMTMNNGLTGSGAVTLDNGFNSSGFPQWGTIVFNSDSSYTGGTNIVKGRLVANTSGGLGTGTVTISSAGNLSFGGAGTSTVGSLTIANPIVITRNTYTSGEPFGDYADAITSTNPGNAGNTLTFSGPFVVDSTDARISANTSTISIPGNITQGPDVTSGMLTVDGDFAGYVTLGGDNSALAGGIQLIGGVELNVSSQLNLGGASSILNFNGSATLHPVGGFMTNFGTHVVNYSTFNGGIDVDAGQQFTISQNLGSVGNTTGSIGERGTGTLTLSGTDILGGTTFWDGAAPTGGPGGGVVNVTGTMSLGSLHLRSPVVNITGSVTTTSGYSSFGQDSTGTNGNPDMATVNLSGNGALTLVGGNDFNVSDNANTSATINIQNTATLTVGGNFFMAKNNGTHATINQSGGTVNANGGGGQAFDLGQGTGAVGVYTKTGGALAIAGEMWVGNNAGGNGTFTQSAGTTTVGSWFVVGRAGGTGTMDISGGTLTRTNTNGGNNNYVGENSNTASVLTVNGTGAVVINGGQFWLGNAGSSKGTLDIADSGSFTVNNNWLAVGRNGTAVGIINISGGTLTDTGVYNLTTNSGTSFTIGSGGTATGTINQTGGAVVSNSTFIGENGTGTYNISAGTATLNTTLTIGTSGSGNGTFNISGTAAVTTGPVVFANANTSTGILNLNGGTLTSTGFTAQNGGGTGKGTFFFNGGTLTTTSGNVNNNFIGAKVTSVVSTGGAIMNANGGYININSALTHDSTLSGADGGLTVLGTGTVQLGTAASHLPINTYTGPTTVNGGTLIISTVGALPTASNVANNAAFVVSANSTAGNVSGTGTTTVSAATTFTASAFTQGKLINNGSTQINGAGAVGGITGTGTVTIGTGTSNNTVQLTNNSGGSAQNALIINAGSTLDITNNHVFINYGAGADPIASIAALIVSGYNGGAWTGTGITSTNAQTNSSSYGIGYADFADAGNPAGLSSGQIEIKYTLLGDANLDGAVNGSDFAILATNFNKAVSGWDQGDFNYDGAANGADFALLASNFNKGASQSDIATLDTFAVANGLSLTSVPEPATISLLAMGGLCIMRRRRRM